jgi:hypothetical protein
MISLSAFENYDTNIIGAETFGIPDAGQLKTRGAFSTARGGLFYARRSSRVTFATQGDGVFSFYPQLPDAVQQPVDAYSGTAALTMRTRRTSLRGSQSVSYQPYFTVQMLPGSAPTSSRLFPDAGSTGLLAPSLPPALSAQVSLLNAPAITYDTVASLSTALGGRASIDVMYGYQGTNYEGRLTNLTSQSGRVQLNRSVARHHRLYASYAYRLATYEPASSLVTNVNFRHGDVVIQDVEAGFSYLRPLSPTRSVGFEMGSGGSIVDDELVLDPDDTRRYRVMAYAGVNTQFARRWLAQGQFRRSLQLLQGLAAPYFGNAMNIALRGELTRRFDISASGTYSEGELNSHAASRGYNTMTAGFRLRYALTRQLALSGEYMHSKYSFGPGAELPTGLVSELSRDVVGLGLTFGVSLLERRPITP